MKTRIWICILFVANFSIDKQLLASDPPWIVRGKQGMVASDSEYASKAGIEILKEGGNAIDAAVAVSFALGVVRPYSTGPGGGGFMIARFADGRVVVQDFRETAPEHFREKTFLKAKKRYPSRPPVSLYGHLAIGVPGLIAGRCQALEKYGSKSISLKRAIAPAVRLADEGFPVDQHFVKATTKLLEVYKKYPSLKKAGEYIYNTHLNGGKLLKVGDILKQPHLSRLFHGIAAFGPDYFYRGPISVAIVNEIEKNYGLMSRLDLLEYQVREREPIVSTYRDFQIISMPPPSSGGIALCQILNILEKVDMNSIEKKDPIMAAHYQIEAMKHAFADRSRWLGDADFSPVPVDRLISKEYAASLAYKIDANQTRSVHSYGMAALKDDAGTSHFCVVDRWGNVVTSSETINTTFGSLVAIGEFGLILNNQMDDFVTEPGKPNAYGLVQSKNNAIEPGKRPLSSMSPTIVLKDNLPFMLLGASGGPRIISSVLNVMLGVLDYEQNLEQAMLRPRPHHQWQPNEVYFDDDPPSNWKNGLEKKGHIQTNITKTGIVQAIMKIKDSWIGASDPRKGGKPAAY